MLCFRALAFSCPLILLGLVLDRRTWRLAAPAFAFVALFSYLPHKELRFIIYTFPLLNISAAVACHKMWTKQRGLVGALVGLIASGHVIANAAYATVALAASVGNYPGGQALSVLHGSARVDQHEAHVHVDNLACQTGVTRFGQVNLLKLAYSLIVLFWPQVRPDWTYDKTEGLRAEDKIGMAFTHLIAEIEQEEALSSHFSTLATVRRNAGVSLDFQHFPFFVRLEWKPALVVMERK